MIDQRIASERLSTIRYLITLCCGHNEMEHRSPAIIRQNHPATLIDRSHINGCGAGYELWYEPRCTVFHKESQSTGQLSKLRTYYLTRNRLLYAWRNLEGSNRWLSIIYQTTLAAGKNGLSFLLKGRPDLLTATIKGISAFIRIPHKKEQK